MFGIGIPEIILILIVGLIVFGPSKLPEVGRAVGKAMREFKKASSAFSASLNEMDRPSPPATQVSQQSETIAAAKSTAEPSESNVTSAAIDESEPLAYEPPTQETVREQLAAKQDISLAKNNV